MADFSPGIGKVHGELGTFRGHGSLKTEFARDYKAFQGGKTAGAETQRRNLSFSSVLRLVKASLPFSCAGQKPGSFPLYLLGPHLLYCILLLSFVTLTSNSFPFLQLFSISASPAVVRITVVFRGLPQRLCIP